MRTVPLGLSSRPDEAVVQPAVSLSCHPYFLSISPPLLMHQAALVVPAFAATQGCDVGARVFDFRSGPRNTLVRIRVDVSGAGACA